MSGKNPSHALAVDLAFGVFALLEGTENALPFLEILTKLTIPRQFLIRILNTLWTPAKRL